MSKLQELIQELCPDGVEYKKLGEIADYPKERTSIKEINCYVGVENLLKDKQGVCKSDIMPNTENAILFIPNDILIGNIRPYLKKIWLADTTGGTNGDVVLIRVNKNYDRIVNRKFLYFILSSDSFFLYDNNYAKGGKMPRGDKNKIKEYEIPLPPFPVQEEIVRILDHFTNLAAELQAQLQVELQARREQYEYYRNKLLTFDKVNGGGIVNVTWMKMSEICLNVDKNRRPIKASNRVAGIYPYYGASGIVDYVNGYIFDGNYLLISEDGANLLTRNTPIAFSITGKNWVNNHAHVLKFANLITQKYVEYYINMIDVSKYISEGAQPKLNQDSLNNYSISFRAAAYCFYPR